MGSNVDFIYVHDDKTGQTKLAWMVVHEREPSRVITKEVPSSTDRKLPYITFLVGLVLTIISGSNASKVELVLGNLFFAASIGTSYKLLRRSHPQKALKIATFIALSIIVGELAAGPGLRLYSLDNNALQFGLTAAATCLATKAIREIKDEEWVRIITGISLYIILMEYALIFGPTIDSMGAASIAMFGFAGIFAIYHHLEDNLKHKETAKITALCVLALLLGEAAGFSHLGNTGTMLFAQGASVAACGAYYLARRDSTIALLALGLIFGNLALFGNFDAASKIFFGVFGGALALTFAIAKIEEYHHLEELARERENCLQQIS